MTAYAWSLLDDAGGTAAFVGPTDGVEVEVLPSAAGTLHIELRVTDDAGQVATQQRNVVVAAAPMPPISGGGGGGAASALWVALLGLGVAALLHERRLSAR